MADIELQPDENTDDADSHPPPPAQPERRRLPPIAPIEPRLDPRPAPSAVPSKYRQSSALGPPRLHVPGDKLIFNGQECDYYRICGRIFIMDKPANETYAEISRRTVGGRELKYCLHVLQEPQKARACGAGPRSSADRRPVDPPPVISLRIFDVKSGEDITFQYDSTFMSYASLEIARPIANGRAQPMPTALPVLTGVCVASAAYLEKPDKAGYFIFPDLSVRHEGWYRLKFSLFEQMKSPGDADLGGPYDNQPSSPTSMSNRMEVVSHPFQVFSAKKFPGLSQSTETSKVLADQGCRVRIRREIRQRKRTADEKPEDIRYPEPEMRNVPDLHRRVSRNSPEYYPQMDSSRRVSGSTMSVDTSYQYRPNPSRAPSIASTYHASPTTPAAPYMPSMPPPPMNRVYEQPPSHYQSRYSYYPQSPQRIHDPDMKLPPIQQHNSAAPPPPPPSRYYNLPEPSATKRTSSRTYNDDYSMKAGARPDQAYRPEPVSSTGVIEADNGEEHEADKDSQYFYSRANGSRGLKVAQLLS